ncbi:uncharacterized protein [Palaemon carinicauda]|uniref:uncharacterized protein n=1 Tax=Palaemon carinicauda TaxID=392227 RepID=UPI0035B5A222
MAEFGRYTCCFNEEWGYKIWLYINEATLMTLISVHVLITSVKTNFTLCPLVNGYFHLGKNFCQLETYFLHHTRKFQTVSVVGERDTRIDFVWATKGLKTYGTYSGNEPERQLEEWAYKTEKVPDVVVVGFGPWIITEEFTLRQESLRGSVNLLDEWQPVAKVLNALSKRTMVLAVCQTRPRQTAIFEYVTKTHPTTQTGKLFRLLHVTRQEPWASDWMDETMSIEIGRLFLVNILVNVLMAELLAALLVSGRLVETPVSLDCAFAELLLYVIAIRWLLQPAHR